MSKKSVARLAGETVGEVVVTPQVLLSTIKQKHFKSLRPRVAVLEKVVVALDAAVYQLDRNIAAVESATEALEKRIVELEEHLSRVEARSTLWHRQQAKLPKAPDPPRTGRKKS